MSFSHYKRRMHKNGKTNKDRVEHEIAKGFENYLRVAPNTYNIKIKDEEYLVAIQDKNFNNKLMQEKTLLTKMDTPIIVGDLFEWSNRHWLITFQEQETVKSHQSHLIQPCNNTFTWQDTDTLEIHECPCILVDKTSVYSDGIERGKYLALADDQIMITVPSNELTDKITKDRAFIFHNDKNYTYQSTKIDKITEEGLVHIVMKHRIYDKNKDNLELGIADYIEPTIPTDSELNIVISGEDKINIITSSFYNAIVYKEGIKSDKEVRFEINNTLASIELQGKNKCKLVANPDWNFGEVILKATLIENEEIFIEKIVIVTGM